MLGGCSTAGISIGSPPLCSFCAGCRLHVSPVLATSFWFGTTGSCYNVNIPNLPTLVGTQFCAQNLCLLPDCVCLSNTLMVRVMP